MTQSPFEHASFARRYTNDMQFTLGTALDGSESTRPVVLRGREAVAHKLVLGLTGSGKSSLLVSMCLQGVNQGGGCLLIDAHGDECRNVVRQLEGTGFYNDERAYKRVVYLPFAAMTSGMYR